MNNSYNLGYTIYKEGFNKMLNRSEAMDKEQEKQVMVLTQAINHLRKEVKSEDDKETMTIIKEMVDLREYILKQGRD